MRRVSTVTIDAEGRDKGKVFKLTELPAMQAERWAMRAFLGMAKAGIDIPEDIASAGLAGIAMIGIKAVGSMQFGDAELLMEEMFTCVQIIPDPSRPIVVRALLPDDIEEVATLLLLRKEVFGVHVSFSQLAARFRLGTASSTGDSPST